MFSVELNNAITLLLLIFMVSVQVLPFTVSQPNQPSKVEALPADGVRVTIVPLLISEGQIPRPLRRFKNQLKIIDTPLLAAG
jgi:hypothetical protein